MILNPALSSPTPASLSVAVTCDPEGNIVYQDSEIAYIISSEGRIVPYDTDGSTKWRYEYHLKDHLGNTRIAISDLVVPGAVEVLQHSSYYPFGLAFQQQTNTGLDKKNKYLYNGKEIQDNMLDGERLDWYDYGARMYDPALGRWHVIDPLAENTYSLTPYRYAQNNPISVFDVAGLSDYFDANGNYFGTDNTDDDYVRIISQENWNNIQVTDDDGNVSVNVEQGMELSTAFSEATDMSEDATLSVYDHYNPTDLDVAAKQNETGAGGLTFHAERKGGETSERIDVKIEGNRKTKMADHANEITNSFAHEEQHYNDYKELGFDGYRSVPKDRREQRAVSTQMKHESYKGTRPGFQRAVIKYGKRYGMLFPLTPKPAVVTPSSN